MLKPTTKPFDGGRLGTFHVSPHRCVELMASAGCVVPIDVSGDGKVTRQFVLEDERGVVVAVWDFKLTSAYDEDLPSPEDFWASDVPARLSIAGDTRAAYEAFAKHFGPLLRDGESIEIY